MNSTICSHEHHSNIDNMAQSILYMLIFCGVLSDCTIITKNFLESKEWKEKWGHTNELWIAFKNYFLHNYKKDEKGNIIIEEAMDDISEDDLFIPEKKEWSEETVSPPEEKVPLVSKPKEKKQHRSSKEDEKKKSSSKKIHKSRKES